MSKSINLASSPVELGVVVEQKKSGTHVFGIPTYKSKIKLSAIVKSFNLSNYKKYLRSIKGTSSKDAVHYIDSIPEKPFYLELEIIDNVGVVKSINKENLDVFNYLKEHKKSSLISKIRTVVSSSDLSKIKKANAFYLQTKGNKQQYLMLYKGSSLLGELSLYGTGVFGYESSFFCWKATKFREITIATMISKGQKCTNDTERDSDKLINELTKNSFKF